MKSSISIAVLLVAFLSHHGCLANPFPSIQGRDVFTCPAVDGFYASSGQCTGQYYFCLGGSPYSQNCNGADVYDPLISRCVPLSQASCKDQSAATTTSTTTLAPTTTTTTTLPTTTRTTTTAATTTTTTTPRSTTTTTTPRSTTTLPSGFWACPSNEGFFPIPNTCAGDYYVCVSGSPYVSSCPGTSIYDPITLKCMPPAQASCNLEFTCTSRKDGFYPIPGKCTGNYYACVSGAIYTQTCPAGAIFDPSRNSCVAASTASCTP